MCGNPGSGKTALAVHWAHRVADQFPDGQLYVNLRGFHPTETPMAPADAIRGFLDALNVTAQRIPADLRDQTGLYRSLLAGRRTLVVLDNAADVEQVRPLLPGSAGCVVVVTSRNQLPGLVAIEGAQALTLDLFTVADAQRMLANRLGTARVAAEPAAVDEIIASCARLPLALAIVAARAAIHSGFSLAALASELQQTRGGLDMFHAGDPTTDVRAVFSWSYRQVSTPAARLFRLLGLHPGADLGTGSAASLAGCSVAQVRPLLAELAHAHLVSEHTSGRYTFHDLLRSYATELAHGADTDTERLAAVRRLLDHYLHTAHTAALMLEPHRDPITLAEPDPGVTPEHFVDDEHALAWFTAEHATLLAAIDNTVAEGLDSYTWQLAWTLPNFLDRHGHWHDSLVTQTAALAAAQRLGDGPGQALSHRFLGYAHFALGRPDDAHPHYLHALDRYQALGDHAGQARTYYALSLAASQQGRYPEALSHAEQAVDRYRLAGDQVGQARALNGIGWQHALTGDHQQALHYCRQALALLQELGDRTGEAQTWDSLGYAHHHLGDRHEAVSCYRNALDMYAELGDRYREAEALSHLGDLHQAAGDLDAAHDTWQHALTILDQLAHPDADGVRDKLEGLVR